MPQSRASFAAVLATVLAFLAAPSPASAQCADGILQPEELCVTAPVSILPGATWVRAVLAEDLDGDGDRDVVAVTHDRVYVRLGTGAGLGPWAFVQFPLALVDFRDVAAGDFDGDLDLDVAVADAQGDRVFVLRNTGGPNLAAWVTIGLIGADPVRIFAAPVNAAGFDDLVVFTAGIQAVRVVFMTAGGPMAGGSYAVGDTPDVAIGDVDADGDVDLVYVNGQGTSTQLRARLNTWGVFGNPFASALPLFDPLCPPMSPLAVVAGDLNGDGAADAAVSATCARLAPASSNVNGTFAAQPLGITWASANRIRAFDADQNTTLDVLAPHLASDMYSVQFGAGNATFPNPYAAEALPAGAAPTLDMAGGDFNGDGIDDILVATDLGVLLQRRNP
jgi:hypothetical protein